MNLKKTSEVLGAKFLLIICDIAVIHCAVNTSCVKDLKYCFGLCLTENLLI